MKIRKELLRSKELASFGDSLVNFLASAILTFIYKRPYGIKVPDRILVRVARNLDLKGKKKDISNFIESFFAYLWLNKYIEIDDIINKFGKEKYQEKNIDDTLEEIFSLIVHKYKDLLND